MNGSCDFTRHTKEQRRRHPFSGMHPPFLIDKTSPDFIRFQQYFSDFQHLLPEDINTLQSQQALQSHVQIRPIVECPKFLEPLAHTSLLVVGGPPALFSSMPALGAGTALTYLNDERRWPIAKGSAWALEEDASSQMRLNGSPLNFLWKQCLRALNPHKGYSKIERTGFFPWQTLDWCAWLKRPREWFAGIKLALCFQGKVPEHVDMRQYASLYHHHDHFYTELNKILEGKILFPEYGTLILARDELEVNALYALQKSLAKEGRVLNILSREEVIQRFGFEPVALAVGEKIHDRVLAPSYQKTVKEYIQKKGGTLLQGVLTQLYIDGSQTGGIAKYLTSQGKAHYIRFDKLLMSLGHQKVSNFQGKPLFKLVCATGVSFLAHIYMPVEYQLPRMTIFGGTNHCTRLSHIPVPVKLEGKAYHLHLVRVTAGACITPRDRRKENTYYDSTIAIGLLSALRHTLGERCWVTLLFVYGCNRSVSQFGETRWIEPYPGIHIQFGAGGGGLTRAPEFLVLSS